ncbi:MAG: 2'-5' RNA ligase family protein [Ginsengibacter sp.]
MKTPKTLYPSCLKYNEYLIVVNPNEVTSGKIISEKKEFSEKYKMPEVYYKPHLMLVKFINLQMIEERLLNHLKNISNGYKPFQVKLKDYGSLPSHTIFRNVESQLQVRNLVTALKPVQRLITLDKENKPHFIDNIYLYLATKLLPWQYEKAWLEYSDRHFTASFITDRFTLLKRPVESVSKGFQAKGSYQVLQSFEFKNSPVITQQDQLFM